MKVMAGAIDKVLSYSVCAYSSFAPSYVPDHIKVDNPRDQGSRWSSESNSPPQYLVLKLERPAIVKHIYFGKYEKNHVCNLKRFKVFGSLRADDNMVDLLEGGLRNDSVGENFPLKHSLHGKYFPCRFIKVMPLQSWGPSFNYSIWYIELRGTDEPSVVGPQMGWYEACKEKETLRLCLKYLRQRRFIDAYEALLRVPGVSFEHPFLSSWFDMLVDRGDFDGCERELKEAIANGMLDPYIESQPLKVEWEPLNSAGKPCVGPGMRGGHQMCIDVESRTIYLFGGWDGYRDLSDFWAFMIDEQRWICLSQDTSQDGGPCPRSCHKMCIDPVGKVVYLLGRFVDSHMRSEKNMRGDFFAYDLRAHKWVLLSEDTAEEGGPPLLFDHQLTFDAKSETVFVCGGRSSAVTSPGTVADPVLVGLYAYSVRTRTWRELRKDCADPAPSATTMRSRGGHSVVLHPKTRLLYIFGGQRNKHSLNDMMIYRIDTDELEMVYKGDEEGFCGPPAGLTQRATLESDTNEILLLRGSSKAKDKKDGGGGGGSMVKNSLWLYSISRNKWSCIYSYDSCQSKAVRAALNGTNVPREPCPRYAHQLVYDHATRTHYLFGGNPGTGCRQLRLDDFWSLRLVRVTKEQLHRKFQFIIRRQRFKEISQVDPVKAIKFLRMNIGPLVDENDRDQVKELHSLAGSVCDPVVDNEDGGDGSPKLRNNVVDSRVQVFDLISSYFPETITQPKANLSDLVVL